MKRSLGILVAVSLCVSLAGALSAPPSWGLGWFGKSKSEKQGKVKAAKKKKEFHYDLAPDMKGPYDPALNPAPDKDYMTANCEPMRIQIVKMNRKFFLVRPGYQPKIMMLKKKYEACLANFQQQEMKFIKNYQFSEKALQNATPVEGESVLRIPAPAPTPSAKGASVTP